jgi:hypothetical protein
MSLALWGVLPPPPSQEIPASFVIVSQSSLFLLPLLSLFSLTSSLAKKENFGRTIVELSRLTVTDEGIGYRGEGARRAREGEGG